MDVDPPTQRIPVQPPPLKPGRQLGGAMLRLGAVVVGILIVVGIISLITRGSGSTPTAADSPYGPLPEASRAAGSATSVPYATQAAPPVAPVTTAAPAAAKCTEAQPVVKGQIEQALADPGMRVDTVYAVRDGKLTYYGANIDRARDGARVSSGDVWVTDGRQLAALSGGARENSTLPDGRRLYDVSAGDEPGQLLIACSTGVR